MKNNNYIPFSVIDEDLKPLTVIERHYDEKGNFIYAEFNRLKPACEITAEEKGAKLLTMEKGVNNE